MTYDFVVRGTGVTGQRFGVQVSVPSWCVSGVELVEVPGVELVEVSGVELVGVSGVELVEVSGAVSYTHLTLPTKVVV